MLRLIFKEILQFDALNINFTRFSINNAFWKTGFVKLKAHWTQPNHSNLYKPLYFQDTKNRLKTFKTHFPVKLDTCS